MRICEYSKLALRTESEGHTITERLVHASLGLASEFAELMEPEADWLEEIGDMFWYLNLASDVCGTSLDELQHEEYDADADPIMNVGTCAGMVCDVAKRVMFYKEAFDEVNKKGRVPKNICTITLTQIKRDLFQLCEDNDFEVEDVLEANIKKLEVRYPKLRFCSDDAKNRNLVKEKEALG